jgi:hypothetical protein
VFLKLAPFLQMYIEYVNGFDGALATLSRVKSYAKLQGFLAAQSLVLGGLDLTALLIAPVQRIPRYALLIKGAVVVGLGVTGIWGARGRVGLEIDFVCLKCIDDTITNSLFSSYLDLGTSLLFEWWLTMHG